MPSQEDINRITRDARDADTRRPSRRGYEFNNESPCTVSYDRTATSSGDTEINEPHPVSGDNMRIMTIYEIFGLRGINGKTYYFTSRLDRGDDMTLVRCNREGEYIEGEPRWDLDNPPQDANERHRVIVVKESELK